MAVTRQEKLQKLALLEEKKKRQLIAKPKYKANAGQLPVHMSKARERYVFSGNGAGKSTLLVNEVVAAAKGVNPWTGAHTKVPAKILVILDTSRKITESFIPELKKWHSIKDEWQKRMGKPYTSRIEFDNGSIVDFYSADADPSSFEGIQASHVFIDEPIQRNLWIALKRSLRLKGHECRLMFTGTAVDQAWLRREIHEPWSKGELPDVDCFRVGSEVNEANLADGYLHNFSRGLSESEREVRLKGGFYDSDSLALAHLWSREFHVIPAATYIHDERSPCVVAIDCHSVKPHTAIMITATSSGIIAIKELKEKGTATQFASALKRFMEGYRVIDVVCDSLGNMQGTAFEGFTSFIDGINQAGVRCRATSFKEKSHEDLIDRLRNGLLIPENKDQFGQRIPKLRVLSNLKGLISDVESATWQKNRATGEIKPKLDTSTKDYLSCWGYALATDLFYEKPHHTRPVYYTGKMYGVTASGEKRNAIRMARRLKARGKL